MRGLAAAVAMAAALWAGTARAEIELSLYGGVQTAPHSTIRHPTLGNDFVQWQGDSFAMPPYYGLRATWWRNARFGYGVEFNHAKVYARDPLSHGYEKLEFTDGLNLVTLNVWRRWQGGRLTPYVGAGLGIAVPHVEVEPVGQVLTYGYQVTGPALQLVAGASLPLNGNWALFGEWKGTWSRHKADLDSGGTLSTEIITNALNIGVSYRF
nr:outer membrane beta-barrel protein [Fertoeibacter niger]